MSDHWDDYFNQEKAPPDFLVERVDVVGEGAVADQLAKLADLYIAKQQGNRIAGLADLGEDLLKLAETGIRDGSSSCAGLMKELAAEPAEESLVISHVMPITTFIGDIRFSRILFVGFRLASYCLQKSTPLACYD